MSDPRPAAAYEMPSTRSRVTNHADLLPGVDGRSAQARRYRDLVGAIVSDQGGLDRCSETRLQLIRRFSAAAVMAEQMEAKLAKGGEVDIQDHALLTSSMVRVAQRIGINRRAKEIVPTLREYVDQNYPAETEEDEP